MEAMENKICLDTDFLVNFLRNKKEEVEFIEENETRTIFSTTSINLFELYYGAYKSGVAENILKLEELQQRLRILSTSKEAMKKAGEILMILEKQGQLLDFRDLLIGTIALTEKISLKTLNKKHFLRIPHLTVL